MMTHYEILDLTASASFQEIKAAYEIKIRRHHPDHASDKKGDIAMLKLVRQAWGVLRDPKRRAAYDRTLGLAGSGPGPSAIGEARDRLTEAVIGEGETLGHELLAQGARALLNHLKKRRS